MAEIDVLKAQLVRSTLDTPWGFRLHGGAHDSLPLHIVRVTPGGPADRIGLKCGDEVTEIGDKQTSNMTHEEANTLLQKYGLSLILTIERRTNLSSHVNYTSPSPAVQVSHQEPQKAYQTYDMSGANHTVTNHQPSHAQPYEFQQVVGRPFEAQPPRHMPVQAPQHAHSPPQQNSYPHSQQQYMPPVPTEDSPDAAPQSRTFRLLQGLMSNQEPYAGTSGLPPPRSAYMEQWKADQERNHHSPRVKVFMPQQYNTPLGMYSMDNVVDSFQSQAEIKLQDMDQTESGMATGGMQQAVYEEVRGAGRM